MRKPMTLADFTDDFISKMVAAASPLKKYARTNPHFYDDIGQVAYLSLLELRQRLRTRYRPCKILSRRNIYFRMVRSVQVHIASESITHQQLPDVEADNGLDAADFLLLEDCWRVLCAKEKRVLRLFYFHGMTQAEVGQRIGVTQQSVSKTLHHALDKMRTYTAGE